MPDAQASGLRRGRAVLAYRGQVRGRKAAPACGSPDAVAPSGRPGGPGVRDQPDDAAESWPVLQPLSFPAAVLDDEGRIVYLNPRAEAFWGIRAPEAAGRPAAEVLRIGPRDGCPFPEWIRSEVIPAALRGASIPARTVARGGAVHLVAVRALPETRGDRRYAQLIVREAGARPHAPRPAARDPLTGLPRLGQATAEHDAWNARGGALILFDLEALREVNALYGAPAGDEVLAAAGQALAAEAPPGGLAARAGADELALLLASATEGTLEALAERVVDRAARALQAVGVPAGPRIHYGVAAFGPDQLGTALRQAADALYRRRGALFRARSGGSIRLTREGRAAVQEPGGESKAAAPGAFASGFSGEFDGFFRQAYARSVEQARDFVALADPRPGSAVVEVGAGTGRITFDGGLAERVGREGQLLVTDPSSAQMDVARRRAADMGLDWVRFVCAPVEALPVEPGTADLCLGALFLHFTEPLDALRAMVRVLRPGGRLAICAAVAWLWTPTWRAMYGPALDVLRSHGLAFDVFLPRDGLERIIRDLGITIDRAEETVDRMVFPSVEIGIQVLRQTKFVALMLRKVPPEERRGAEEAVEARMREVWGRAQPDELVFPGTMVSIVGHR